MLIQAGELEFGRTIETDVCVIGGGAAGIALAREFDGAGFDAWLLESGTEAFDRATQDLYIGQLAGRETFPLDISRLRFFGGTTNHWRGACRPHDPIDFAANDWMPHSGWPISRESLEPYYRRAGKLCELEGDAFTLDELGDPETRIPGFDGAVVETPVFQFSPPTRFGTAYREALQRSRNVTVCLGANVTALRAQDPPRWIDRVEVKTLGGHGWSLRARHFVLATGAIENARLLLASNDVAAAGLGNGHDNVGRYFMDHLIASRGGTLVARPGSVAGLFLDLYRQGWHRPKAMLNLGAGARARYRLGGHSIMLFPAASSPGLQSYRYLSGVLETDHEIQDLWKHIGNILSDASDVASHLYYRHWSDDPQPVKFNLYSQCEQAPNPDSRVVLTNERDALGMPRVALDWRLSELDRRTLVEGQRLIAEEIGRVGLGRVQTAFEGLPEPLPGSIIGDYHHMGTTRMHASPRHGVVDADCRVHGVGNLHVAGSSVFPTCGSANPTLTLLALTLRLADHLREELLT